jgi:MFS family permease
VSLNQYRLVLRRPAVRALLLVSLLARMPIIAAPVVLALHVVLEMHRGFADSGLVSASIALGGALGAPIAGRAMDRLGLRPVLIATTAAETSFWVAAGHLPYLALVFAAFAGGLVAIPIHTLPRQSLAAMLPEAHRQAGFSLDSMLVEISFAVGPAVGIVLLTQLGSGVTLPAIAALICVSGVGLLLLDPPIRDAHTVAVAQPPAPLRTWWSAPVAAILLMSATATFILAGTDTALTAVMRHFHDVPLLGPVFAVWCIASLVGGFVYGAARPVSPIVLLAALGALCIPVSLAGSWWALALLLIPTGLFCAPVMSSTAHQLVRLTPASARGQAMGLQGSALILGTAIGAPVVGLVVDRFDPRLGFLAIGVLGLAVTIALLPIALRRAPDQTPAEAQDEAPDQTPAEATAAATGLRPASADPGRPLAATKR